MLPQVCLLFLALLAPGALAVAAAAECTAEAACASQACSTAYAASAAGFPYSLDYTTTGDATSTTFIWKVCSLPCVTSDPACKPLRALQLRLADAVLADPRYFKVPPPGTVVTGCGPRGPGLLLNATQLQALSTFEPAKERKCLVFSTPMYHEAGLEAQLTLRDMCQQGVQLVDTQGAVVFRQQSPSCMYVAELQDGVSGFSTLKDKSVPKPPAPSSPSPPHSYSPTQPSPQPYAPQPGGSPLFRSPSLAPSPAPLFPPPSPRPAAASPSPAGPAPVPAVSSPAPYASPVPPSPAVYSPAPYSPPPFPVPSPGR